jgi:hypothetical protein
VSIGKSGGGRVVVVVVVVFAVAGGVYFDAGLSGMRDPGV